MRKALKINAIKKPFVTLCMKNSVVVSFKIIYTKNLKILNYFNY